MNIEDAQEIRQSRLWEMVKAELGERIFQLQQTLMTVSPEELVRVQAKLRTLMEIQRLPEDIIERES